LYNPYDDSIEGSVTNRTNNIMYRNKNNLTKNKFAFNMNSFNNTTYSSYHNNICKIRNKNYLEPLMNRNSVTNNSFSNNSNSNCYSYRNNSGCSSYRNSNNQNILISDRNNNIYITKNNKIKLGNFGIEKLINSQKEDTESNIYLSPEKIKGEECNNKTDIWNLGIILYELTQLCHPFFDEEINIETIKENIEKVDLLEFININYSARLLNLIKSLFILDPNKRPEINKILLESYTILIKRDSHSKRK
jgi:hypothetical protein